MNAWFWGAAVGVLVSLIVGWIATEAVTKWLVRHGTIDVPNERSSHSQPTPRGGGLGILIGAVAGGAAAVLVVRASPPPALWSLGVIALGGLGAWDDLRNLSARFRLLVQVTVAAVVAFSTGGMTRLPLPSPLDLELGLAAIPFAVIWIVAITNIYNFLDGIDGFAGLQAVVAATVVGFFLRDAPISLGLVCLAGAAGGFLVQNWQPARVFMGDIGSMALGFGFATAPLFVARAQRSDGLFLVGLALWFFLADGTFTLLRRVARRDAIWKPHKTHLYQRLHQTGLSHARVSTAVLTAGGLVAVVALWSVENQLAGGKWFALVLAALGFGAYYAAVRKREQSRKVA